MMHVKFKTDNAAFAGDEPSDLSPSVMAFETARILREIAHRLEIAVYEGHAIDSNGNSVGTYKLTNRQQPQPKGRSRR